MRKGNTFYNKFREPQSWFDHDYACWAINHNGWRKMIKQNRRTAKRRLNQFIKNEIKDMLTIQAIEPEKFTSGYISEIKHNNASEVNHAEANVTL